MAAGCLVKEGAYPAAFIKSAIVNVQFIPAHFFKPDAATTSPTVIERTVGYRGGLRTQQFHHTTLHAVLNFFKCTVIDRYIRTGSTFIVATPVHVDGGTEHIGKDTILYQQVFYIINAFIIFLSG